MQRKLQEAIMNPSEFTKPTILIVDDDNEYCQAAKKLIEAKLEGYPIVIALDPITAIHHIHTFLTPFICMIDYTLPDMDGLRLIKHINKVKRFPIVTYLVTAQDSDAIFIEALRSGASGYFSKHPPKDGPWQNLGDLYIEHIKQAECRLREILAPEKDLLTGAHRPREGRGYWVYEWNRAKRDLTPTSCIFIDVNELKLVNDTYGHLVGDAMLAAVGTVIRGRIRHSNFFIRYGGDEFVIILPNTLSMGAKALLKNIKRQVSGLRVENGKGGFLDISISGGVSAIVAAAMSEDDPDGDYKKLIKPANDKMRRQKTAFRKVKKAALPKP